MEAVWEGTTVVARDWEVGSEDADLGLGDKKPIFVVVGLSRGIKESTIGR